MLEEATGERVKEVLPGDDPGDHALVDDRHDQHAVMQEDLVGEHMNSDHIDVGADFSDTQIAEVFLHHRVLIVPIVDDGVVTGIVTRQDFFGALARRFLDLS